MYVKIFALLDCCSIQKLMRYHGAKGNLSSTSATMELDERFDVLIDANDQLLERVVKKCLICN